MDRIEDEEAIKSETLEELEKSISLLDVDRPGVTTWSIMLSLLFVAAASVCHVERCDNLDTIFKNEIKIKCK